jgi:hypothetical protein
MCRVAGRAYRVKVPKGMEVEVWEEKRDEEEEDARVAAMVRVEFA